MAVQGLVCKEHRAAAREVTEGTSQPRGFTSVGGKGWPANYPAPTLLGSPFTTLALTQNYLSHLHCEPEEHPYSFIVWADVLSSGSSMEVRGEGGMLGPGANKCSECQNTNTFVTMPCKQVRVLS
jgi:hypothetical protein